ncbi:hypothetical protein REPUB_Repub18cG0060200 [Reevesia pubescens]
MESQNPQTPENLAESETPPSSNPTTPSPTNIVHKLKKNLAFQSKWAELNGAMGDLGTYIPIVLALTLAKDLNLGTTLIFTGIYNIVTGAIYGVPMPVQPMKSIAAVALSNASDFNIPEIMAAGICTGAILLVLGATGLMQLVYKLIPLSVVRGIQLSQGLSFAMTAVKYITKVQDFSKSKSKGNRHWLGLDGLILAIVSACFIIVANGAGEERNEREANIVDEERNMRRKRIRKIMATIPSAFIIFLLGVVLAFISVCKFSSDLFPGREFSATSVSVTVGLMNLVGCWFGAMPCCHGAGGLAGQYKFGGRSGGCVAILGAAKMVLGLALGTSLVTILQKFPVGLLGVLLLYAGIELAMTCRDMNSKEESFVMLICTAVSLVGSSAAVGFVCGMVLHVLLRLRNFSRDQSCSTLCIRGTP